MQTEAGVQRGGDAVTLRDSGFSFVEVVVTIVLMGVLVIPILAAVRTSIQASSTSEVAAEVETVLVNAVDRVTRAPRTSFPCDLSSPAKAAAETHGWQREDVTVRQKYWEPTMGDWSDWTTSCPPDSNLVQLIEITVSDPEDRVTRTLEVVKGAQL